MRPESAGESGEEICSPSVIFIGYPRIAEYAYRLLLAVPRSRAAALGRASRRAGDARVDAERVGARREELLALSVAPGMPRGSVVAQEGHEVPDGLNAFGGMGGCDAWVGVAARFGG